MQNLKSTKAVKVLKTGINILAGRVLVGKILRNISLKIQCRRYAIPQAWELNIFRIYHELYLKIKEIFILSQKCSGFGWVTKPKTEPRTQPKTQALKFSTQNPAQNPGFWVWVEKPRKKHAQCRSLA